MIRAWIALLSCITSAVVIVGSGWVYDGAIERPRPVASKGPTIQPSPSASPRKAGATVPDMILAASHLCGVPPGVFYHLVVRESSMRQWDSRGRVLRSSSGALGLAQVKPGTARGVSPTLDIRRPWDNLVAGACYYRQMLDRFGGDSHRALVAYHNGPNGGRTRKGIEYADDIMEESQ